MKTSGWLIVGFVLLAVGLAVAIGSRLSDQAIAALVGAACGIGLAGPLGVGLGVYIGSTRSHSQSTPTPTPPQVIVIPAPSSPTPGSPGYSFAPGPILPAPRSFTIIGEEDMGEDNRHEH